MKKIEKAKHLLRTPSSERAQTTGTVPDLRFGSRFKTEKSEAHKLYYFKERRNTF